MKQIAIDDQTLRQAAASGMDDFVGTFVEATLNAIGGELNGGNIGELNGDQVTLLAYQILRDEVMDGGFVQLIHNGYGPFFFRNPFAKAMRQWEIPELAKLMNKAHKLYSKHGADLTKDCTDEEFMSLFEHYPDFDDLDDAFVEHEEEWTAAVARYIDAHIERFAEIRK
ncbi:MAG: DMP19 family protein [Prevotella sp.]|nr:DMP19 family protein [Prevotella sp.]